VSLQIDLVAAARRAHAQGNVEEAKNLYMQILQRIPHQLDALNGLAALNAQHGNGAEAVQLWQRAIAAAPHIPEFKSNLAKFLQAQNKEEEAFVVWRDYVQQKPDDAAAWNDLGRMAKAIGRYGDAARAFEKVTQLKPSDQQGWIDLLYARLDEENLPATNDILRRVKIMAPDHPVVLNAEGMLARAEGNLKKARKCLEQVVARKVDFAAAWNNLGVICQDDGDYDAAVSAYEKAIALAPKHKIYAYNRTNCHLVYGHLSKGWETLADWIAFRRDHRLPQKFWDGSDVRGKKILLWNYQGVGEDILQLSMVDELLQLGAQLIIEATPRMAELVAMRWPNIEVVMRPDDVTKENPRIYGTDIDYQAPGFWACKFLRPTFESFPQHRGAYLQVDEKLSAQLRQKYLSEKVGATRVIGISWRAAGLFRRRRSLELADWLPLFDLPKTVVVDVQYGDTSDERKNFASRFPQHLVHDETIDAMTSLAHQAAQLKACDAVVSVRNSTVHLAGALNIPCQVLMPPPQASTWFWFRDRATSPWYPSLTLHPLHDDFAWQPVMNALQKTFQAA